MYQLQVHKKKDPTKCACLATEARRVYCHKSIAHEAARERERKQDFYFYFSLPAV